MQRTTYTCDVCKTEVENKKPIGWWTLTCAPARGGARGQRIVLHLCDKDAKKFGLSMELVSEVDAA